MKKTDDQRSKSLGFTLVELLIVIALISSLAGLFVGGFRSSQAKGRDVQRKSDLKEIANGLELMASDYKKYPDDNGIGGIKACPFDPDGVTSAVCTWGSGEVSDGKTIYLKKLPKDPISDQAYYYRLVPSSNGLKFQIFARLENSEDKSCLGENCTTPGVTYTCGGSKICNFAVTSPNTDYSE